YVHPIQVEVIQLEAAQRRLQRTIDVFASVAARVGIAFLRIEAELAGDHQLVAQTDIGDEAPQYLFGLSAGVHIGAVQHVAATFDIAIEDAARFGVVRSPSVVAKRHRSQRKRTDPQPRTSQRYVFIQLHEEFIPPLETSDGSMMQTIHYPLTTSYSYRKLSTGSSWAARAAGMVPNSTPTSDDTSTAMTTDRPEIGIR